jgi:ornithine lipid ester-linked acyl 2-hydroxylase
MNVGAFLDPCGFPFTGALEAAGAAILAELRALGQGAFVESPDSLTTVSGPYDETGWLYCGLVEEPGVGGGGPLVTAALARCPATARALAAVLGLVNSGFSLFRPGTRLYPHRGERQGLLRCHLPLIVPEGDVALRIGRATRSWRPGRCLLFDDTQEHEAWNLGAGDRVLLIVTVARAAAWGGTG